MSRIDELIAELCPAGVRHAALGEVGSFIRGNGIQKKNFTKSGVGCIHYGQIFTHFGLAATETKSFVSPELAARSRKAIPGDLVIATTSENDEDVCKAVAWLGGEPVAVSSDAFIYRHSLEPKFVSYFFNSRSFQDQKRPLISGTKVRRVSGEGLAKIRIPVPPLEVQREIVRVLDKFTQLEAELEAELEARRRQFAHYRALLLGAGLTGTRVALGDITVSIASGRNTERAEDGVYPVYGSTGRIGSSVRAAYSGGRLLVARVGFNAGRVQAVRGEFDVSDNTLVVQVGPDWDLRFAYHQLTQMNLNQYAVGGGQPLVTARHIRTLVVTLPSPEEQERIAAQLDAFEALLGDPCLALPAELSARRRQYGHYRDRLLTFKELAA